MANHKSSLKRIRQASVRRLHNRYYGRSTRNQIKRFRMLTDKDEAKAMLPKVSSMIDKLARERIIHKNKAANLKSKLARQLNRMVVA